MRKSTPGTVAGTVALLFSLACDPDLGKWEGVHWAVGCSGVLDWEKKDNFGGRQAHPVLPWEKSKSGGWQLAEDPASDSEARVKITLDLDEPSWELTTSSAAVGGGGVVTQSGTPQMVKTDNDETFTLKTREIAFHGKGTSVRKDGTPITDGDEREACKIDFSGSFSGDLETLSGYIYFQIRYPDRSPADGDYSAAAGYEGGWYDPYHREEWEEPFKVTLTRVE